LTSSLVTLAPEPTLPQSNEKKEEVSAMATASPTPVPVRVRDVLVTENEGLLALFGDSEKSIICGDTVSGKMQVIEDTVGITRGGEGDLAEFFAKDESGAWLRLLYRDDGKIHVENCEEERRAFVEDKTRTDLCLTWVGLENTAEYNSELFVAAQEELLSYLQKALFDGAYFEVYQKMEHVLAAELLGETATYSQFVWYVDNLRTIIQQRISDQMIVNFLGCDVREGYCYAGVQFGNYNPETEDYRKVVEVWCALFYEREKITGFWLFGPDVLENMEDEE